MNRFIRIRLRLPLLWLCCCVILHGVMYEIAAAQTRREREVEKPDVEKRVPYGPSTNLSFWPHYQLPCNGKVVIQGTPERVEEILDYAPFLLGGDDTVRLRPVNEDQASSEMLYVLLEPERNLQAGRSYFIYFDRYTLPRKYDVYINDTVDLTPPDWTDPPAYIGGTDRKGSHYFYLALPISSQEPLRIECVVEDSAGNRQVSWLYPRRDILVMLNNTILESTTVPLQLDPGSLMQQVSVPDHLILLVGNGNMGGEIYFQPGTTYQITMTAVDPAGNRSIEHHGKITVPTPPPPPEVTPDQTDQAASTGDDRSVGIRMESSRFYRTEEEDKPALIPRFEVSTDVSTEKEKSRSE